MLHGKPRTGERQKTVNAAYRDGWDRIFKVVFPSAIQFRLCDAFSNSGFPWAYLNDPDGLSPVAQIRNDERLMILSTGGFND